ncbi:GNAT family acetyltransferase [Labedella phragmitis]|uniref:GNAT family acetyltransferase n=1 Tax=Labedella phragmitis TaxID=2498849 RepID=A0A444PQF1_9MICO|nr:GNAT family acetyltransferase [Labedella phragmitis]RWZ49513.1 GNAT family acetyltransferase [Labedella phragmitis]
MRIRSFQRSDTDAVVSLWEACGLTRPWNDPLRDIERKLTVQPELFLVGEAAAPDGTAAPDDGGALVATLMAGYEGHRGWLNYLAVDPAHRGRGFGRLLVSEAETQLEALGCPKVNLQVRADNSAAMRFYETLGYAADGSVSMGKRIIPD